MQLTTILALVAAPLLAVAQDYPADTGVEYPVEPPPVDYPVYPTSSIESTTTCTSTTTLTKTITVAKTKSTSTCYNSTMSYHPTPSGGHGKPSSTPVPVYPTPTKTPPTVPTAGAAGIQAASALLGMVGLAAVALL